jgi:hypothetical protein
MSNLDGINYYGDNTLEDIITKNISSFLSHGLLELGAYYNIYKDQTNPINGSNESILQPQTIPGVSSYIIYKGLKHDWVWESNINIKSSGGQQPIQISGIYVNNVFYSTGTKIMGTGYYVDYSRGRVIFSHPLSSSYVVKCPHTLRWVQVYDQDSQIYRKINFDWANRESVTGIDFNDELKAYLPCVFVKVQGYSTVKGTELGSRGKESNIQLEFNIFSENSADDRRLSDILYFMESKNIPFFNIRAAPSPLLYDGSLNPSGLTWPNLISQYLLDPYPAFNEDARIVKFKRTLPIYHSRVNISLNVNLYPV